MKYQLILQWPASSIKDYESMIKIEEVVIDSLGDLGRVDGHDAGSGEMNLFVLTDHPKRAFERAQQVLGTKDFMPELKAAYREIGRDQFTILFPPGLKDFSIA